MPHFTIEVNSKGYVQRRESYDLEFKQAFHYGDSLFEYTRSLVGMANHLGGQIVFGVKDKPHVPVGLHSEKFTTLEPAKLNAVVLEYFSADVPWNAESFEWNGKQFGVISVREAHSKPIICRKSFKNVLREGAIYFRYRGETKEIRYAELANILEKERDKEKHLWMQLIERIGKVGPHHAQVLDTRRGELSVGDSMIVIDKSVVDQLRFVQEGRFSETDGAPTLKLVGEVSGILEADRVIYAEAAYPYTMSHVLSQCGINNYDFQAIAWKHGIKGDTRYHTVVVAGRKSSINKYSQSVIDLIRSELRRSKDAIKEARQQYAQCKTRKT